MPRHLARVLGCVLVLAAVVVVAAAGAGCAPRTRVVAAWKDPTAGPALIQRPLIVFQHASEAIRRSVEDELVERIPDATPSYRIIPTNAVFDIERVRRTVHDAGYDTVLVMRLVDVEEQLEWVPGAPRPVHGPLWDAWGTGWTTVYDPPELERTMVVTLESLLYSLDPRFGEDGELIWASRSETFDPKSLDGLATSIVRASLKALQQDGLYVDADPSGRGKPGGARAPVPSPSP